MIDKATTVIATWNGTNGKINAFHANATDATRAMQDNWRLYAQRVPVGKYKVGDEIDNADLLDFDLQL